MSASRELEQAARAILPRGIGCAVVPIGQGVLLPAEQAAMARAVPVRRAEFAAGRLALRLAMADAGLSFPANQPILPGADRRPDLPPDHAVSLSHAGGLCIAIARHGLGIGLGVDIEPHDAIQPDGFCDTIRPYRLKDPRITPLVAFCAKEALFKRQYVTTRRLLDFTAIAVVLNADGRFAGWVDELGLMHGKWAKTASHLLAISIETESFGLI